MPDVIVSISTYVVIAAVVAFAFLWPIALLVRQPVYRRLAIRQAFRRTKETALVIIGAMFGTALITASLIVGDGLRASTKQSAVSQLGPVDLTVSTPGTKNLTDLQTRFEQLDNPFMDSFIPAVVGTTSIKNDNVSAEPSVQAIELSFDDVSGERPVLRTGLLGATPNETEVVISADLAKRLRVIKGQTVQLDAYGKTLERRVKSILPRKGVAGLLRLDTMQAQDNSLNVFLAPGTLEKAYSGLESSNVAAPSSYLLVTTVDSTKKSSDVAKATVCGLLGGSDCGGQATNVIRYPVSVVEIKKNLLTASEENSDTFTQIFSALAAFSVVAGVFLLITIMIMLAQDRKTRNGVLRALGMKPRALMATFFLEGWFYSLLSSAFGALVGIAVARGVVSFTKGMFQNSGGGFSFNLVFSLRGGTLASGFAIGNLVSLITIFCVAWWTSKLNIIQAIRDLPSYKASKQVGASSYVGGVVSVIGIAIMISSIKQKSAAGVVVAPALIAFGFYLLLRQVVSPRLLLNAVAGVSFFWSMFGAYWYFPEIIKEVQIPFFIAAGLVNVFSIIVLFAVNQTAIAGFVSLFAGRSSLSTRLGFAYPNARKVRTGLIVGIYALVIFALGFITIYNALFSRQVTTFTREYSAGNDLLVDGSATAEFVPNDFAKDGKIAQVVYETNTALQFKTEQSRNFTTWQAVGIGPQFANHLINKSQSKKSDNEVLKELADSTDTIVVDDRFLQRSNGPSEVNAPLGSSIVVRSPFTGKAKTLKVVAMSEVTFGESYAMVSQKVLRELNGVAPNNRALLALDKSADTSEIASQLQLDLHEKGALVRTFRSVVEERVRTQLQLFQLLQGYLALGLLIGVAGLGVVMIRSVRERKRQIGMLRAMGFSSKSVRRAFEIESTFVALEGITAGLLAASLLVWRLDSSAAFGGTIGFFVPWGPLTVLGGVAFLASIITTIAPASRASHIQPAVALRIND